MKQNRFFKTFLSVALIALTVFSLLPLRAYGTVEDISAAAAFAYEPVTGTVLYEKNADERMLVASTTKIMTALVVLENCAPEEVVAVTMQDAAI